MSRNQDDDDGCCLLVIACVLIGIWLVACSMATDLKEIRKAIEAKPVESVKAEQEGQR